MKANSSLVDCELNHAIHAGAWKKLKKQKEQTKLCSRTELK